MKKKKSKQLLLAALTGLLVALPAQHGFVPETIQAAQVSASHDSKLSAFDIAPGVLSPAFSPDITEYTSTVGADVTSVSVQAVPRASGAVIASVEGRDGLRPGVNTIKVTCSAQDNTFTVYTITLTVGSADAGTQQPQPDTEGTQGTQGEGAGEADGTLAGGSTGTDGTPADSGTDRTPADDGTPAGGSTGTDGSDGTDGSGAGTDTQQPGAAEADGKAGNAGDAQTNAGGKKRSLAARLSGAVKADGTVKLSGAAYQLSSGFTYGATSQDIPSAFGQGSLQIGDSTYSTLYCENNGIHLVYMENTDGKGATGFYYYDEAKNRVERFKYMGSGEQFVVFISNARQELPLGYQEKTLKLPSGKKAAAYQNQYADELKDYYLVYGIYSDGSDGWYLYDKKQDTYMRYSSAFASAQGMEEDSGEEEVARTVSLTKYNTLNEKYTELKENRVKIVSILVVAIVLIIIIFTALLLRSRDSEDDGEADARERAGKKKTPHERKQTEAISKSSLAAGRNFEGTAGRKAKKVTKTFTKEPAEEFQKNPAAYNIRTTGRESARENTGLYSKDSIRDKISTPEEIRAQVSREQDSGMRTGAGQGYRYQGQSQLQKEPRMRSAQPVSQAPQRVPQAGASTDSVQMAAERMRQSVRYPRAAKAEAEVPEHDPMDDWDMEETAGRRPHKAGRAARKKRGYKDDDMEIMDLNDL